MTVNINEHLDLNITDFLLLQEISEMKLNRNLSFDSNNQPINFYDNYKEFKKIYPNSQLDNNIINQFYVSIGSLPNIDNIPSSSYIGGAGAYTKISQTQADYFLDNYEIVDYYGNDNTGFSATTFKNKKNGQITISFRSTEFTEDYYKDAAGADDEISKNGTAIAQNISLVNYLNNLKTSGIISENESLNLTGYSLGGHLASSAYQYLTADGYSINKLYVFNGPGVGNVLNPTNTSNIPTTENFGYLEKDLLNYTQIINMFNILKSQNITDVLVAKNFINQNSSNSLTKDFFNNIEIGTLSILLYQNYSNSLLSTATLKIYDIYSNLFSNHEDELSRILNDQNNHNESYFDNTIYKSDLYLTFKNYIIDKYNMSKAASGGNTTTNTATEEQTLIVAAQSEKTGIYNPSLFGNNALWLNGQASVNNYDYIANDFNFVANSNNYGENVDIVIEDRPETEDGITRLPISDSITKNLKGDFGNTHSITLLNKTLNLMATLAKLEGKYSIDVSKYSALISSASKERASHFYLNEDGTKGTGDYNAIANIINTLSNLLLVNDGKPQIMFDNTIGGWANIDKINALDIIEKKLINKNISNLNLVSLYNIKSNDMSRTDFNSTSYDYISKTELINKSKNNIAYRYALDNLNTFVIEGIDYSNYIDQPHSDEWYSTRADVLLKIIDSNVQNLNNYISSGYQDNIVKDSYTNIYINDNKQDVHFYSHVKNMNVNYKIYNQDSYYGKSQGFNELSSLDSSLFNTLLKVSDKIKLSEVASAYPAYTALGTMALIFAPVTTIVGGLGYLYFNNKNQSQLNNLQFNNPHTSLNIANYFSTLFKGEDISTYISNFTYRDSLSLKDNVYFLDNFSSDFNSNNYKNKNEKIFINVDKQKTYDFFLKPFSDQFIDDFRFTNYKIKEGKMFINSIDDMVLNHEIYLKDGDDYIEINDDGESRITSTSGKKDYYLKGSKTYITDPDKSGTITLDGILLDGGEIYVENDVVDPKKRVQTYTSITEVDELGNPKIYKIIYEFKSIGFSMKDYHITNEQTGHTVILRGLNNFGNGNVFGFKNLTATSFNTQLNFSHESFISDIIYSPSIGNIHKTIAQFYDSNTDFEKLFNIEINISSENMVLARDWRNKKDLFIYDKTNPSNMVTISDYFTPDGQIKSYEYYKVDQFGNASPSSSTFTINNSSLYYLLQNNPTLGIPGFDDYNEIQHALGYTAYELSYYTQKTIHYSPFANYYLDNSVVGSTGFKKEGNDLIVYSLNYKESGATTIKNYFAFDHSQTTNFYTHRYGENIPMSIDEILQRAAVRLDENSSHYIMNENSYHTVVSGFGDDTVVGTSNNETFISQSVIDFNNGIGTSYSDGNDTFTGGGGADIYSFDDNFGYDTITDFNNDSIIYIDNSYQYTNYNFNKKGNDLIIYKELNPYVIQDYSQVTIKNYFTNIDYLNNSRIIFTKNKEHFSDLYNNPNYTLETYYNFNNIDMEIFNTINISKTNDTLIEQKVKDNSNNTIDTTKLTSSHIKGNDLDNTIVIKNNDTIIHSNESGTLTDGNDTIIVDISNTEAVPLNHNIYRTTIQFGFNNGHDSLLNGQFKETGQYGDIIDLKNMDFYYLTVNQLKDNNNSIIGFNLILLDGSSLLVQINDLSNTNVDIIKNNTGVLKLSDLIEKSSNDIFGDSSDNYFDFSTLLSSININTLDGNDTIIGTQADDTIEGGKGFEQFKFSKGFDTYKFNIGSDIDQFDMSNLTSDDINKISAKFLIDSSYKQNNISYSYNANQNEAYLKLSNNTGVIFKNVSWNNFVLLVNNLSIQFTDNTYPDMTINYTNESPFSNNAKIVIGSIGFDYLQTNNLSSSVVYAKDSDDTIVTVNSINKAVNYLIGGKGDDIINSNSRDILIVKDGDGIDTVRSNNESLVLEILQNDTRLVNNQETLFDLSSIDGTNDLKLTYGSGSDSVTIKDFFASMNYEVTVALYNNSTDRTYVYDNLNDILSTLNISKSSLLTNGTTTVYKNTTNESFNSTGYLVGGEIAYQYLNNNYLQDQNKINYIVDKQLNGNLLQSKIIN